ncbi:MAG: site-specific integrase [Clostridiaceae bacterium]|jgi:integrase/recombinase XerD|nr:site-specific integrase [Clostridiaceae bacterium]NLG89862.1 site-specific integrase [Clostridiaceae bacterium]
MSMNSIDFASLVTGFLTDYLPLQRCYSKNTILSYRDTLKLLLRYISMEKGINLRSFQVKDFKRELILEFLEWYRENGASCSAANQRLGAIKAFADYAQLECIEYISPLLKVSAIKAKKSSAREVCFLSVKQMSELINKPDINTPTGFRHRVILTLLYDSGCRVQELCDLTIADIFLNTNSTVRLHGKGNKYRTVVISDETANLIKSYISRYVVNALGDPPLVTNRYHQKIDRDGIGYIISKYVTEIHKDNPSFPEKVHCHMFRHSKAMHMLEAGINIVYIRDFLGHEDISTTMIYVRADNRLKNEAINKLSPKVTDEADLPDWNRDKDLMEFLNSLK